MVNRTALIVGDCFVGYGQVENVFTVTSFAKVLRAVAGGSKPVDHLPSRIRWGQGVGEHERAYVMRLVAGLAPRISIAVVTPRAAPAATRGHVHKRAPQNVLISVPVAESATRFVSDLVIDARNELLIDHVTGQHVQGMVLVEACRQMFLAVTEEHLCDADTPAETYFVIKAMNIDFQSFVFPMDAQIVFTLGTLKRKEGGRLSVDARITVVQGGADCAACNVSYSVFDAAHLSVRELKLAQNAVEQLLATSPAPAMGMLETGGPIPVIPPAVSVAAAAVTGPMS